MFFEKWKNLKYSLILSWKKETPALVFSYEFCKVFKNIFFYRTRPGVHLKPIILYKTPLLQKLH